MIVITGSSVLRPEHREQGFALGIEHSARSRAEPGCIAHNCHADAENPDRIVFVEEWADMAAVQTHFEVPESGEFVRQLRALALDPPSMRIYQADALPAPEL